MKVDIINISDILQDYVNPDKIAHYGASIISEYKGTDASDTLDLASKLNNDIALIEWDIKGYHVIITTGRKESAKEATTIQMQRAGINYDQLIMGFGGAVRYIINDRKPNTVHKALFSLNYTPGTVFKKSDDEPTE